MAALAAAASMVAVSMAADLAAAGAAAAGAAVGEELAGEVAVGAEVVGGGVDRRYGRGSGVCRSLWRMGSRLGSGLGRSRPVCALAAGMDWLGLARGTSKRLLVRLN